MAEPVNPPGMERSPEKRPRQPLPQLACRVSVVSSLPSPSVRTTETVPSKTVAVPSMWIGVETFAPFAGCSTTIGASELAPSPSPGSLWMAPQPASSSAAQARTPAGGYGTGRCGRCTRPPTESSGRFLPLGGITRRLRVVLFGDGHDRGETRPMITVTDSARTKAIALRDAEGQPDAALRVGVQGGGCS